MKKNVPEIKKKVNAFLLGEQGKMSKDSIIKAGLLVGAFAVGVAINAKKTEAPVNHSNSLSASYDSGTGAASANHSHHASHSSHGSHGSHAQW